MPQNKKSRKWMDRKKKGAHPYKLWICKELIFEWESGNITADQVLFLAKIDSFIEWLHYCSRIGKLGSVIKKYLHKKHGVWMTDQELATRQGVSRKRMSNMLSELSNQGYILRTTIQYDSGSKRYLKTCWTDSNLKPQKRSNSEP